MLRFARPNGWTVVTNFGTEPYQLEGGDDVVLASHGEAAASVPAETTVWLRSAAR